MSEDTNTERIIRLETSYVYLASGLEKANTKLDLLVGAQDQQKGRESLKHGAFTMAIASLPTIAYAVLHSIWKH